MFISRLSPVLLFGTLWGLSEVSLGNAFYANEFPYAAIVLNAIAVLVLAAARTYVSFTGSFILIGMVAMVFKIFHSPFFACHLLAILMFATGFEMMYYLMMRQTSEGLIRRALTGMLASYTGFALFGVLITFVIRYEYWLVNGSPNYAKVADYIFVQGSIVAMLAAILAPVGMGLTEQTNKAVLKRLMFKPIYVNLTVLLVTAMIWVLA